MFVMNRNPTHSLSLGEGWGRMTPFFYCAIPQGAEGIEYKNNIYIGSGGAFFVSPPFFIPCPEYAPEFEPPHFSFTASHALITFRPRRSVVTPLNVNFC